MTARPVIASAVVLAAAVATMSAAAGWMSKPYNTWTDLEVKEVLNDSPWADKGGISYIKTNGASSQPIEDVALVSWVSAVPMRQAAIRQQLGASPTPSKEAEAVLAQTLTNYVVSVKVSGGASSSSYASNASGMQPETFLLREGKPPLAAVQSDARMLDKDGKVVEMPAPRGGGGLQPGAPGAPGGAAPPAGRSQQMGVVPSAFQRGGGGGGFGGGGGGFGGPPGGGGGGPRATTSVMLYMFPKTDAITIADKEVEFVTKLCSRGGGGFGGGGGRGAAPGAAPAAASASNCQYSVKKKFKLKDMMYNGELAL